MEMMTFIGVLAIVFYGPFLFAVAAQHVRYYARSHGYNYAVPKGEA